MVFAIVIPTELENRKIRTGVQSRTSIQGNRAIYIYREKVKDGADLSDNVMAGVVPHNGDSSVAKCCENPARKTAE